jgi:hypothetical protein
MDHGDDEDCVWPRQSPLPAGGEVFLLTKKERSRIEALPPQPAAEVFHFAGLTPDMTRSPPAGGLAGMWRSDWWR